MLSAQYTANTHQLLKNNASLGQRTALNGKGYAIPSVNKQQGQSSFGTRFEYGLNPRANNQGVFQKGDRILQNITNSSNKNPIFDYQKGPSQTNESNLLPQSSLMAGGISYRNLKVVDKQFEQFKTNAQSTQLDINFNTQSSLGNASGIKSTGMASKYFGFKSLVRSKKSNVQALPRRYSGLGDFILSQDQAYSMENFLEDQKYCEVGVEDENCLAQYAEEDFMDKKFDDQFAWIPENEKESKKVESNQSEKVPLDIKDFSQILNLAHQIGQKYKPDKDVIVRSSCSASIPTDQGYNSAKSCYEALKSGDSTVEQMLDDVREEMMLLYDLPKGTGIFFASSSSNAQIIAFMIAKALNPYKGKILNILTESEDQYSNSLAADSKFFQYAEALSNFQNMTKSQSEDISNINNSNSNDIIQLSESIAEQVISRCDHENCVPVVHKMYGNRKVKEKESRFIEKVKTVGGLVFTDCVRGVLENFEPAKMLEQDEIVTITGSKFFRGPLNAEAVIVPESIMAKLKELQEDPKNTNNDLPQILNSYICRNDIPKELTNWRDQIHDNQDPGLALRWIASITEMHSFNALPKESVTIAQINWAMNLLKLIDSQPSLKSSFNFDQDVSQHTVFQISVASSNQEQGEWLGLEDMELVHRAMGDDLIEALQWGDMNITYWTQVAAKRCHVGKALMIEEGKAFITVSLDSESLVNLVEAIEEDASIKGGDVMEDDHALVQKLSLISKNFVEIKGFYKNQDLLEWERKSRKGQSEKFVLVQNFENEKKVLEEYKEENQVIQSEATVYAFDVDNQIKNEKDIFFESFFESEKDLLDFLEENERNKNISYEEFLELVLVKDKSTTLEEIVESQLRHEDHVATITQFLNKKDESEGETEDQQFSVPDTFAGQDDEMLAESLNVERYTQSYMDRKNKYAW